ncbi:hypothetical protein PFISCL1PPCAC_21454, partial [Pristionchus fissidentatus]
MSTAAKIVIGSFFLAHVATLGASIYLRSTDGLSTDDVEAVRSYAHTARKVTVIALAILAPILWHIWTTTQRIPGSRP